MVDRLIGLLAPHTCVACGMEGSLLCAWCRPEALTELPDRCYRCNAISLDSAVCKKCRRSTPLSHVWICTVYDGAAKELIYKLKFGRAKAAAATVAELIGDDLPDIPKDTIVTFIPTATSRVRLRGYDQSKLIAQAVARRRGLGFAPLLTRVGQARQVGADRKHRIEQAAKNYQVKKNLPPDMKRVLIIDDILTTGATLESAARLLKQAGIKHVSGAVFAKKQ